MSILPLLAAIAPPRMRRVALVGVLIAGLISDPVERLKKAAEINKELCIADDLHAFDLAFSQVENLGISHDFLDRSRKDWCARALDFASHRRAFKYRRDIMESDIRSVFRICV